MKQVSYCNKLHSCQAKKKKNAKRRSKIAIIKACKTKKTLEGREGFRW